MLKLDQLWLLLLWRLWLFWLLCLNRNCIPQLLEFSENICEIVSILYTVLYWIIVFYCFFLCYFWPWQRHQKRITSVFFVLEFMMILLMNILSLVLVAESYLFGGFDYEVFNFVFNLERKRVTWHSDTRLGDLLYLHSECLIALWAYLLNGTYLFVGLLELALSLVKIFSHLFAVKAILSWKDVVEADSVD